MYRIDGHVTPTLDSSQIGNAIGAYFVAFINYSDIDGAYELVKYYVTENGWSITEIEEEYFIINSEEDVEEDQLEYFNQATTDGYSIVFYTYDSKEKE